MNLFKKKNKQEQKTIRDEFAMSVISGIVKEQGQIKYCYRGCDNILMDNCNLAYKIADAMIETRNK